MILHAECCGLQSPGKLASFVYYWASDTSLASVSGMSCFYLVENLRRSLCALGCGCKLLEDQLCMIRLWPFSRAIANKASKQKPHHYPVGKATKGLAGGVAVEQRCNSTHWHKRYHSRMGSSFVFRYLSRRICLSNGLLRMDNRGNQVAGIKLLQRSGKSQDSQKRLCSLLMLAESPISQEHNGEHDDDSVGTRRVVLIASSNGYWNY
ncbi:hypothetical protein Salat_2499400 [Sesamum alatum]|uniref:Uncharacterized protein n=1 Tax=Sesamum alatum TaxID=300844 RepID=A0AAE1XRK5_9LAMI|nr:hypothetical protein Salat_2499400 [Sesamum alatum]